MAAGQSYLDFDLVVERAGDAYRSRVIESPAGEATGTFSIPFSELELENFFLRMGQTRRTVRRIDSPEVDAARRFGTALYDAAFSGDVDTCYRRSLDEADRQGYGLRVRLRLGDTPELQDLPWELLYCEGLGRFLLLSTTTPLVRYLDLPDRIRPLQVTTPLRLLVVVSSPHDYPGLDVQLEYEKLSESVAGLVRDNRMEIEITEDATLRSLQRRLRNGEYHALHFIGHGAFDEMTDEGVLLFEDEHGRGRKVAGRTLGTLLHDHRSLRLVLLNACEGARSSREDPFGGVAQSLLRNGVPAVIAMQFEIPDEAAIVFADEFYAALADGYPVDAATAAARKAVMASDNDVEWATPVLYLRSPDGRIFDVAAPPAAPAPEPGPAAAPEGELPGAPQAAPGPAAAIPGLPDPAEPIYVAAVAARAAGDLAAARDGFTRVLELDSGYRDAADQLSHVVVDLRADSLAAEVAERLDAGDVAGARDRLQELREVHPSHPEAPSLAERVRDVELEPGSRDLTAPAGDGVGPGPAAPSSSGVAEGTADVAPAPPAEQSPAQPPSPDVSPPPSDASPPPSDRSRVGEPVPSLRREEPTPTAVTRPGGRRWIAAAALGGAVLIGGIAVSQLDDDAAGPPVTEAPTGAAETTLPATVPATAPAAPVEDPGPVFDTPDVVARAIGSPPVIDGDLADWRDGAERYTSSHRVFNVGEWDGSEDHEVEWRLAFDDRAFYVAAVVTDDIHAQVAEERRIFQGDGLNLDFDLDVADAATPPNEDDYQLILSPGDLVSQAPSFALYRGGGQIYDFVTAVGLDVRVEAQPTPTGYVLEAEVPWAALTLTGPPGPIGFRLSANDNDREGQLLQEVMYSNVAGSRLQEPATYGTLTLSG